MLGEYISSECVTAVVLFCTAVLEKNLTWTAIKARNRKSTNPPKLTARTHIIVHLHQSVSQLAFEVVWLRSLWALYIIYLILHVFEETFFIRLSILLTERLVSSSCKRYSCLKNDSCMIFLHPYYTSSFKSKTCNIHIFQIHRSTKWHFLSSNIQNSYDSDFALIDVTKLIGAKVRWTVGQYYDGVYTSFHNIHNFFRNSKKGVGFGDRCKYTPMSIFKVS